MKHFYCIYISLIVLTLTAFKNDCIALKPDYYLQENSKTADYLPNTIIIKYKTPVLSKNIITYLKKEEVEILEHQPILRYTELKNLSYEGQSKIDEHGINRIYSVTYRSTKDISTVIRLLLQDENIEYAEPNYIHHTFTIPDDPAYSSSQPYLHQVKSAEAWNIQADANHEIIAIIDSGSEINHPDLANNIYINHNDPIDGIDNDGDGYVDNYYGWDFAGSTSTSEGDNDPNVKSAAADHGVHVSGIASAVTNNGIGMASIAKNAKLLILKAGADNEPTSLSHGYQAIIYAADKGAKIINCSWGSTNRSNFGRDAVNYAISKGCLIIAAAGNSGNEIPLYPAAFDGVLAVVNTDLNDRKNSTASYGYHVALSAPGTTIYSTTYGGNYANRSGSSMAAPLVSSAAALIAAKYPQFTGLQIGELLKKSTDDIYHIPQNQQYINKLGTGRLNIEKALNAAMAPAIKKQNITITDASGAMASGSTVKLSFQLVNLLNDAANLTVRLATLSSKVTIHNGDSYVGYLAEGDVYEMNNVEVYLHPELSENEEITFYLSYTSPEDNYDAKEYFVLEVNRDYVNYAVKDIETTITGIGRIGFVDFGAEKGNGFKYKDEQLLFEAALMIGNSITNLSDNVRVNNQANEHFVSKQNIVQDFEGESFKAFAVFTDEGNPHPLHLEVTNTHIADDTGGKGSVLVEYEVKNTGTTDLNNVYVGLFTDWDIDESDNNITKYNPENRLAYAYSLNHTKPYAGVVLLTDAKPHYYPLSYMVQGDLLEDDYFTKEEKFKTITSGIYQNGLGENYPTGLDIMYVSALGPFHIKQNESVKPAFAFVAGDTLEEIIAAAQQVRVKYNEFTQTDKEKQFVLQNYPNPIGGTVGTKTNIVVKLPEEGQAKIELYNLLGQHIQQVFQGKLFSGSHTFEIDLKNHPSGVYYCNVIYNGKIKTIKISLTK